MQALLAHITFVVAFLYFIGWAYFHYFLAAFGINIATVEVPFQHYLIYAIPCLSYGFRRLLHFATSWWGVLTLALAVLGTVILAFRARMPSWVRQRGQWLWNTVSAAAGYQGVQLLLIALLFIAGDRLATASGQARANEIARSPATVARVVLKEASGIRDVEKCNPEDGCYDNQLMWLSDNGQLSLVFETPQEYFLFRRSPNAKRVSGQVFRVAKSNALIYIDFIP